MGKNYSVISLTHPVLVSLFFRYSSLGMMYAPQSVEPQYASTAGMFGAAMLITGIFSGIMFSWLFPWVVATISW